jgi:hypothetical protein
MARKKAARSAPKSPESTKPASREIQPSQSPALKVGNKEAAPEPLHLEDTLEFFDRFEISKGTRSLMSRLDKIISTYVRIFIPILNISSKISDTPQGRKILDQRLDLQKKKEEARNAQIMARAEIDLAIARRLETAESVEIEETYDSSGKGHAGLNMDEKSTKAGVGGEGQRVVKRKIILKGAVGKSEKNGGPASSASGEQPPDQKAIEV